MISLNNYCLRINQHKLLIHCMAAANCTKTRSVATAGVIVIGDEILKGYTKDTNSTFLCRRLFSGGIKVEKISVIPDDIDIIAREVRDFSDKFTHVITTGGVGPTHDDVTFEGVAKAFDDTVIFNENLVAIVERYFGPQTEQDSPVFKLARIPKSSQLLWGTHKKSGHKSLYPVVRVRNVTVFPGIPRLLERAFDMLEREFMLPTGTFHSTAVYLDIGEFEIAKILTNIQDKYKSRVNIGSYPKLAHSYYKVKVMLDSDDASQLESAKNDLLSQLPAQSVVAFDSDPMTDCVRKFDSFLLKCQSSSVGNYSEVFGEKIHTSMANIRKALETYALDELCIALNGGKDCTALLHLVHIAISKLQKDNVSNNGAKLKALYIHDGDVFEELTNFTNETAERYSLELITIRGEIKHALKQLKSSHPQIKAIFMGTRHTDLSYPIECFTQTDSDWPEYMRISPLLDWTYHDIWRCIRGLWLPYCVIYDKGYTSAGKKSKTSKNAALQFEDGFGFKRYRPAFMLNDETLERNNRS